MKNTIYLLLIMPSLLMNGQNLNEGYVMTTVQSGFDDPMTTIVTDDFSITAERAGNIIVSENFIPKPTPIITRTPNTIGEGGELSMLHRTIDGIVHLWIYDTVDDAPNYGNISLHLLDINANTSTMVGDVFSEFYHTQSNHQGGTLGWYVDNDILNSMNEPFWLICTFGDSGVDWSAQRDSRNNGKVIRIDPYTGQGHPNNPHYSELFSASPESRQYAKGFRNGWRPVIDDNKIYMADVGSDSNPNDPNDQSFEEISIVTTAGQNGAWPFFEGFQDRQITPPTNPDTGQPYVLTNQLEPILTYTHDDENFQLPNGEVIEYDFNGRSVLIIAILEDFGFPGGILFMDFFKNELFVAELDENDQVTNITSLGTLNFSNVSHGTQHSGDIYLTRYGGGSIHKIVYEGTLDVEEFEFDFQLATKTFYIQHRDILVEIPRNRLETNTRYFIRYQYQNQEQWKQRIYTTERSLLRLD